MTTAAAPQSWPCAANTCSRQLRQPELEARQWICDPCVGQIGGWLRQMPNQLIVLREGSMQREVTGSPTRSGTRTPPMAPREDTMNLTGPAAPGDVHDPHGDQHGPLPIAATLGAWAQVICEEHQPRLNGPRIWTELTLAAWMPAHLPWAARQEWAGCLRDELFGMMRAIWGITNLRPQTRPVTRPCPRCQSLTLTKTDGDEYIRCACGNSWTQQELNDDAERRVQQVAA